MALSDAQHALLLRLVLDFLVRLLSGHIAQQNNTQGIPLPFSTLEQWFESVSAPDVKAGTSDPEDRRGRQELQIPDLNEPPVDNLPANEQPIGNPPPEDQNLPEDNLPANDPPAGNPDAGNAGNPDAENPAEDAPRPLLVYTRKRRRNV
ncbi:unnamed protein product [Lactuca saligna]|uniref:Uncharacterized protein n=1 Tax=Lactuca saligna TaxID=75948 RepID=A0AA35YB70_LACSI|nr:unnamed protein product [Lactuca saligna]